MITNPEFRFFSHTIDKRSAILMGLFPTVGILILNGFWTGPLFRSSPIAYWLIDVLTHLIIPALALFLLAKFYRIYPRDYGFGGQSGAISTVDFIGLTLIVGMMFWISYVPVSATIGSELSAFTYLNVVPAAGAERAIVAVYFAVSGGLFGEIMYRGLPWLYFSLLAPQRTSVAAFALISSLLFGFAHWENGLHEVFATFVLGFVACVLYAKIRCLWPFVIAHIWLDLVAFWSAP